jgi:hypothetical protein
MHLTDIRCSSNDNIRSTIVVEVYNVSLGCPGRGPSIAANQTLLSAGWKCDGTGRSALGYL